MPFSNDFVPVNFVNKSVTPTGTPDIDAAFLNYVQSEMDQIGDGLATYSSALETLQATVTALGTPFTDPMYISGLGLDYSSGTQLIVRSGACYIPATGTVVQKSTDTTVTLSGLTVNTWYHMYAANVSGSLSIDAPSTTAPAVYQGPAKQKSGDSSRRYLGSFRTLVAAATMLAWTRVGNFFLWKPSFNGFNSSYAPLAIIDNKRATTISNMDFSGAVPVGTKMVWATTRTYGDATAWVAEPSVLSSTAHDALLDSGGGDTAGHWISLDSNLLSAVRMDFAESTGTGFYARASGYQLER